MKTDQDLILASFGQNANTFGLFAPVEVTAKMGDDGQPKPATFEIVAYNGGVLATPAYMQKFGMPVVIDLSGLETAPSVTANMDHDQAQRVGHVTETRNDGRQLILAGIVSGTGAAANEVIANAKQGYPWQASVEAVPLVPLEKIEAGKSVTVNGQRIDGPVLIARKSRLYGVAFLARGADSTTSVKIAATAATTLGERDVNFQDWIIALGLEPSTLTEVQSAKLKEKFDAEVKASGVATGNRAPEIQGNGTTAFDLDGLKVAYAKHEHGIEATAFEYQGKVDSHKLAEIKAEAMAAGYKLKSEALQQEWAPTRFEVEAIKAEYAFKAKCLEISRPVGPAIHSGTKDVSGNVIEAAMATALRVGDVEKSYDDKTLQAAHSQFRGRIGLQQVIIMAAAANGMPVHAGQKVDVGNIREVLQYAFNRQPIHASSNSTVSLSGILSNIANKMLLEGFREVGDEWRMLADVRPVSDFKKVTSYRLLDDMEYKKLGANGEIEHGKVGEESFERSASTYARMFSLTRPQIINDDLGAFDDIRTRLGLGAARAMRRLFWTTFLDNSTFFTTPRGNYFEGAATNLLIDGIGLQTGITTYRKLKSGDKKRVGSTSNNMPQNPIGPPSMLVVPPELEFVAEKLHTSGNLSTVQDDNIHRGKYRPVVVNELSDTEYSGSSSTAWYLFGSVLKPMVVSVLNGIETPTVESAEADFNQLGIQFRGYHDFGCDKAEWLAGVKSKGAA
jgi:hypothetical protein